MRAMAKNRRRLYYALQGKQVPVYEKDEEQGVLTTEEQDALYTEQGDDRFTTGENIRYEEIDGELVPIDTGTWETLYSEPVMFYGNINSGNTGYAIARAYGISMGNNDAVLYYVANGLPIKETSLIWYRNTPRVKWNVRGEYAEFLFKGSKRYVVVKSEEDKRVLRTIDYDPAVHRTDPKSADYTVRRVPPCLDEMTYLLRRLDSDDEA